MMKREGQFQASSAFLLPWVSHGSHDAILRAVAVACGSQVKTRVPVWRSWTYTGTTVPYLHPSIALLPWDVPLWLVQPLWNHTAYMKQQDALSGESL